MTTFDKIYRGFEILRSYGQVELAVAHDQLWAGETDVTENDRAELEALGWFEDEDSWSHFV